MPLPGCPVGGAGSKDTGVVGRSLEGGTVHKSSYQKMDGFRRRYLTGRESQPLRILDVGSLDVNGSYRPVFDASAWTYHGLDMVSGINVDIVIPTPYDWRALPTSSYDVIITGQALEHVEYFWITILEAARVLRPGGLLCAIAPSGGFEHRYPVDCWRYFPDGFRALARWALLDVIECSTEWQPADYGDDSATWKDTLLVAIRRRRSGGRALRHRIRQWFLLSILRRAARRADRK
jgi:SAM-dependent methyltransferase